MEVIHKVKKKYSLDFSIERDTDRLEAVRDILDTLEKDPTPSELEQMASYILFGKDENGKNGVQRGEITDTNKRYNSYQRQEDKNQSLDEILDNPAADQMTLQPATDRYIYTKKKPIIQKAKYDKQGNLVEVGDSDIPGMKELWEDIARLERTLAINEGKLPADENTQLFFDSYRLYQFKHMLIDRRRHQYYLKDAYKPTLHFTKLTFPSPQTIDWDGDSQYWITQEEWQRKLDASLSPRLPRTIDKYETRKRPDGTLEIKWVVRRHAFDWYNTKHIKALMDNYSNLAMETSDKPNSWGRTLILDFDRYVDMANLSEVRQYILLRKIDKAHNAEIMQELQEKFGVQYSENHLTTIFSKELPNKIVAAIKKHDLLLSTPPEDMKKCKKCGKLFPKHTLFFGVNNNKKDGWSNSCRECERKRRAEKIKDGEQNDARSKDPQMLKVSAG